MQLDTLSPWFVVPIVAVAGAALAALVVMRSKPTWHAAIPWEWLRGGYRWLRWSLFSAPEPARPAIVVDASLTEVRQALGDASFAPNWEYSYYKRGEDLNLARVEINVDHDHVDGDGEPIVWWQTHVRGWARDGELALRAHWEAEPTEHPRAHLEGVGHYLDRAMTTFQEVLDEAGIDYQSSTKSQRT